MWHFCEPDFMTSEAGEVSIVTAKGASNVTEAPSLGASNQVLVAPQLILSHPVPRQCWIPASSVKQ